MQGWGFQNGVWGRTRFQRLVIFSHTHTTTGNPNGEAPGFHTANATEVYCKEQGKGEGPPTPNTYFQGQYRVSCHWSLQVHLCRLCECGKIFSQMRI